MPREILNRLFCPVYSLLILAKIMPRAPKPASTPSDVKPYASGSSPPSPTPSPGKRAGTKGRPWTVAEKLRLFEIAVKHGASVKHFEGQFEGRTGHQCYLTWQ